MANRPDKKSEGTENPTLSSTRSRPQYLESALRLPTSYPLGMPRTDSYLGSFDVDEPVPGYMVAHFLPSYGFAQGQTSALVRATDYDFNIVRSQISGNRPYEAVDMTIYRACVDGLAELYTKARTLYCIMNTWRAGNLYTPRGAFEAMGLDYDDWSSHKADLYQWLTTNHNSMVPFPRIPLGAVSARHLEYATRFYTDSMDEDSTGQIYIMHQMGYWSYEDVDQVKGIRFRTIGRTYAEFLTCWENMYKGLRESSDVYLIAADIKRAFADRVMTELPNVPTQDEEVIIEKKDLEFLRSMMNSNTMGFVWDNAPVEAVISAAFQIKDSNSLLTCNPSWSAVATNSQSAIFGLPGSMSHINIVDSSDTDAIHAAFRFKWSSKTEPSYPTPTGNAESGFNLSYSFANASSFCTEVIAFYSIATINRAAQTGAESYTVDRFGTVNYVRIKGVKFLSRLSNFDWHPPIVVKILDDEANLSDPILLEDTNHYVPVSPENIRLINEATVLANFELPN